MLVLPSAFQILDLIKNIFVYQLLYFNLHFNCATSKFPMNPINYEQAKTSLSFIIEICMLKLEKSSKMTTFVKRKL